MKRILLSMASVSMALGAFAQLPVSTTPENKKVILEEYTGMYCTFCPDGHKIAEQIRAANPNDVFLINVHTGSFATPSGSDPDFRTTFGSALAAQTGLTGYPSGTVNRHVFSGTTTALSRGSWDASATTILGQASYVNVALEADIDVATRTMTVDLEAYFTANGASSVNINVAVTQNNIEGPQTGGATYNPGNVLPNGMYNHGHMLRHLITGQWGDVVTTTTSGTTVTKQYTWTIPADINGVPVEIGDLEVIGFVVEGQQEIISGAEGPVSFTVPPGVTLVDLTTEDVASLPSDYCAASVVPSVKVTNLETASCSGYEISYSIDGGTPVTETITAALAGGASATHNFPAANLTTGGAHSIAYSVELTSATEIEIVTGNNGSASPEFLTISPNVLASKQEDFESATPGDMPVGVYVDGTMSNFGAVDISFLSQTATTPVGGYAESDQSLFFYFWNNSAGTEGTVFFDQVNLDGKESAFITMDHAYTSYQGSNDKLEVFVSDDCGATWASVWMKSGADLKTADELNQTNAFFIPEATDWVSDVASLDAYIGKDILVKITGTSDFGDCLYVDNIHIAGVATDIKELFSSELVSTFPNPANDVVTVEINADEATTVNIAVMDVVGKVVYSQNNQTINGGVNRLNVPTANLESGVYFVNISKDGLTTTKRVVVKH